MILRISLLIITYLLLSAHFLRDGDTLLSIACLIIPFLLFIKKKWSLIVVQLFTYLGVIVWIMTLINLINERVQSNDQWIRMILILLLIIALTTYVSIFLNSKIIKDKYY